MSIADYQPGDRVEVFDRDRGRWCPGTVKHLWSKEDLPAGVPANQVLAVTSDDEFEGDLPLMFGVPDDAPELVRRLA